VRWPEVEHPLPVDRALDGHHLPQRAHERRRIRVACSGRVLVQDRRFHDANRHYGIGQASGQDCTRIANIAWEDETEYLPLAVGQERVAAGKALSQQIQRRVADVLTDKMFVGLEPPGRLPFTGESAGIDSR